MTVVELRVLDGPNLYFTRPAIKLTLGVAAWLALAEGRVKQLTRRAGFRPVGAAGAPNSDQRRRYIARFAVHVARRLADATATHLAIRGRPGPGIEEIVVAFVWRRQRAAESFARELAPLLELCLDGRRSLDRALVGAADRLDRTEPGPSPTVLTWYPSASKLYLMGIARCSSSSTSRMCCTVQSRSI